MTTTGSVREAWPLLEDLEPRDLRIRVLDSVATEPARPAFAVGLDALGRRHLLIPVAAPYRVAEDRRSSGVQITRHVLVDAGVTQTYVDVVCAKAHLHELFDVVADEMIGEVAAVPGAPDAACKRVLERWRDLIEQEAGTGAGPERLAGLYAELWHLRALAQLAPGSALAAWVGPRGGRHDYMGPGASLEVKATLDRTGRFPEIHSADQLEAPTGAPLYLAMMKLERVAAAGETVGGIAEAIVALGVDRRALLTMMKEAGFRPEDLTPDHPMRFAIVENRVYRVDDAFPAITPASFVDGSVPAGVLRLRYVIDLSGEPPMPIGDDEVAALHRLLLKA